MRLTPKQLEQWALSAIEVLLRHDRHEDSLVEFKKQMPTGHHKVARRLAGHANAAHGEPVLWVIGVDEESKSLQPGKLPEDGANFWPQVWKHFDGPAPELLDVHVEYEGTTLLALGFMNERVPYVIRTGTDSPRLEVPWRTGSRIDTATRSQLIRLVLPVVRSPRVELVEQTVSSSMLTLTIFVTPPNPEQILLQERGTVLEWGSGTYPVERLDVDRTKLTGEHPFARAVPRHGVYLNGPAQLIAAWKIGTSTPKQPVTAHFKFEPGELRTSLTEGISHR